MPATPIKDAALRYSPEIALAFQPTLTLRPATKKSLAVFDFFADQKPIQIVTMTVAALKARIQGSMFIRLEYNRRGAETQRTNSSRGFSLRLRVSAVYFIHFCFFQRDGALDEHPGNRPHEGKEQHAEGEPSESETKNALRHGVGEKVVQQWQAKQCDEKGGGAGNGELALATHQGMKK